MIFICILLIFLLIHTLDYEVIEKEDGSYDVKINWSRK